MPGLDFVGKFRCSLDMKNRVNIPSAIRKVFAPEAADTIVFAPGLEGQNLYAYPLNEWKRLTRGLRSLNPFDTTASDFIRNFVGDAHNAKMDGQGRLMLPEYVLTMGKIEKEILIIGALTKLEIWNPQVFEEYNKKHFKSLADLAKQINFGDVIFDDKG